MIMMCFYIQWRDKLGENHEGNGGDGDGGGSKGAGTDGRGRRRLAWHDNSVGTKVGIARVDQAQGREALLDLGGLGTASVARIIGVDDGLLAEALVSSARGVGSDGEVDVAGGSVDGDLALRKGGDQGSARLLVAREGSLGLGGSILSRDGGDGDEEGGKKGC
ncbi:MAG: hypothetical protein JOS17DRAFT_731417 [Linnemannia elongata]|nr:MAG: hypothetical protein JOS17DRAFT_731417 [Linnemannia elongata]